jgi:nucleoside-diphosphate-sugar epimerase
MLESNIMFGSYLLEAMVQAGVANIINTSTAAQHYNQQEYSPTCLYAATKQAYEAILTYYTEVHGLRAITLTLFDTYGPLDRRKKLLQLLQIAAATNMQMDLTPGEQMIDLVHIDDVVRGYIIAADHLLHGNCSGSQKFMLSSGKPAQIKELVKHYEQVTGCSLKINWGGKPYQVREIMIPWNGGIPLPGWQANISLIEGLKTLDSSGKGCTNVVKQQ